MRHPPKSRRVLDAIAEEARRENLDPDLYCIKHGKSLLDGPYGHKAGGCEDCEPPEPDGEAFRGGEAAGYLSEQQAKWQKLK